MEKLEMRYLALETARLPSVRARIERIGSRVRKARCHAKRARAHADTAILILLSRIDAQLDSASEDLARHVDFAKRSRQLADDLLEISLTLERRQKRRSLRAGEHHIL
ncbi:hypothetical protein BZL54_22010 [Burkholderia ubonensis subsp. mesacidophila]|uniref:Uncharacterized protein n=1 Tax=Burkholderia ubonensis subsp. mesacidophila TaxID=265293 RepID=A0A2A4FCI3_9BURK|nr:hypothetical protein BZL54_22010 [Burkholderia ubonensis subsp. mesacidophila]